MSKYSIEQSTLDNLARLAQQISGTPSRMTPDEICASIGSAMERDMSFYSGSSTDFYNPFITSIGDNMFYANRCITTINCPSVTSLGVFAFNSVAGLIDVYLPSLDTIGNFAFYKCSGLTNLEFEEVTTINQSAFRECTGLTTISLPQARIFGAQAFRGCSSLERIELPSATELGAYIFYDTPQLKELILRGQTECKLNGAGFNTHNLAEGGIYVPDELVNNYKQATNWIAVADYIKPISELEVAV